LASRQSARDIKTSNNEHPTLGVKLWRAGSLVCGLLCALTVLLFMIDGDWQNVVLIGGLGAMFFY
jgi:hypothetical protein